MSIHTASGKQAKVTAAFDGMTVFPGSGLTVAVGETLIAREVLGRADLMYCENSTGQKGYVLSSCLQVIDTHPGVSVPKMHSINVQRRTPPTEQTKSAGRSNRSIIPPLPHPGIPPPPPPSGVPPPPPSTRSRQRKRPANNRRNRRQQLPETAVKLFIAGFPESTTKPDLLSFFSSCGTVMDVCLYKKDGRQISSGHLFMKTEEEAQRALGLNGSPFKGGVITVRRFVNRVWTVKDGYEVKISVTDLVRKADRIPPNMRLMVTATGAYVCIPADRLVAAEHAGNLIAAEQAQPGELHEPVEPEEEEESEEPAPVEEKRRMKYEFTKNCDEAISVKANETVWIVNGYDDRQGYTTVRTPGGEQGIVPSAYLSEPL